jgi:hydrogenase maturation protein HypF
MRIVTPTRQRLRIVVHGIVQGVGFRPFVHRLADELGLTGWVSNDPHGVVIECEGSAAALETFVIRLNRDRPAHAVIQTMESTVLDSVGSTSFEIRPSIADGKPRALILPDLATCDECLRELFDPADRRYRYPFLNCTHCGPRFSIIRRLPYDRPNTTMRDFSLCAACRHEYDDPRDRRFHAQPIACPACGPRLELWDVHGRHLADADAALTQAADAIRAGEILALKGLGGFHLLVDARNDSAVRRLRERKHREAKPLALMSPSLANLLQHADVTPLEERLLTSMQAPILLVKRKAGGALASSIAPGNPYLGAMLAYTPLHHLLMRGLGFPVVATSGNRSDEPICTDEREAVERLADIADVLLVHNRPIARHVDDSVVRVVLGREQVLRRARGYAPLPIDLDRPLPPRLAVGGHLKNTVALAVDRHAFISQHLGDLETVEAVSAFEQAARDLPSLYATTPESIVCDLHPDYASTRYADRQGLPVARVQHHKAHVLTCMAENRLSGSALGIAWDGAGYGDDGTIWGGEFFLANDANLQRVAHLRPFPLPGGEAAMREPRRAALGVLFALLGDACFEDSDLAIWPAFSANERAVLRAALSRKVNTPITTSAGRLFDAAAALANVCMINRFEGEAAMTWEWLADGVEIAECYPMSVQRRDGAPAILDWGPMLSAMLADLRASVEPRIVSARFHNGLVEGIVSVCKTLEERRIVLSGGCFLNRRLLECVVKRLHHEGFQPYWHQRVPCGDGGIALGQLVAI